MDGDVDGGAETLRMMLAELANDWESFAAKRRGKPDEDADTEQLRGLYIQGLRNTIRDWESQTKAGPDTARSQIFQEALERLVTFSESWAPVFKGADFNSQRYREDWRPLMQAVQRAFEIGTQDEFAFRRLMPEIMDCIVGKDRPAGQDGRFTGPVGAMKALLDREAQLVGALHEAKDAVCTCVEEYKKLTGGHHADCPSKKVMRVMNGVVRT